MRTKSIILLVPGKSTQSKRLKDKDKEKPMKTHLMTSMNTSLKNSTTPLSRKLAFDL